jgi:hypothetical protein
MEEGEEGLTKLVQCVEVWLRACGQIQLLGAVSRDLVGSKAMVIILELPKKCLEDIYCSVANGVTITPELLDRYLNPYLIESEVKIVPRDALSGPLPSIEWGKGAFVVHLRVTFHEPPQVAGYWLRFYPACNVCGKSDAAVKHRCSACRVYYYCNEQCQNADWPKHKLSCGEVKRVYLDVMKQCK